MPAILKDPFFVAGLVVLFALLFVPIGLDKLGVIDIGSGLGFAMAAMLFGFPLLAIGANRAGKK